MILRIWVLVSLVLLLQHATAQSFQVVVRQDEGTGSVSLTASTQSSEPTGTASRNNEDGRMGSTDTLSSTASRQQESVTSSPEPTSTGITTNGPLDNSNFINATIPEGQLPLAPELTPAFGVAGAVLLCTGVAYTLIGIKNRWVHTFFSSAYLAALGITVLLVYIMKVPLSNALQGGYVAAVILPACLLGGASVFFKELTEGLGSSLGGFCISMWLLCLVPGGLLKPVASKAIFIACFTLVGSAFYFSRYTRDWALILLISFAGATVTVLGIDCFSRAGLKEFWAYIWDLNDDLFPLGANTYPVTKGIRVETAAIIIIFLFGIISQVKLWRVVSEQKQKRAAERAAEQQDLEQQEADLGRRVENMNARERRAWERAHGNGEVDSSLGSDVGSEKRVHNGVAQMPKANNSDVEVIEMSDMSEPDQSRVPPALMEDQDNEGKVTIRVAEDDTVPAHAADDEETLDEKAGSRRTSMAQKRISSVASITEAPEVIPLPFNVPQEDDKRSQADRSSVATFADEDAPEAPVTTKRNSLAKRFSQSSGKLLRSFSQRSARSGVAVAAHADHSGSSEDLVVPHAHHDHPDDGSVAATFDNESVSGDDRRLSHISDQRRKSIEITAELSDRSPNAGDASQFADPAPELKQSAVQSPVLSTSPVPEKDISQKEDAVGTDAGESGPAPSEKPRSVVSVVSTPVSLTKDRLPRSLSKVALSYRTNEWAKHLSHAETPEPEQLDVLAPARAVRSKKEKIAEEPKPVNIEELQQTASEGIPPAKSVARTGSKASTVAPATKRVNRQTSGAGDAKGASEDTSLHRKDSTVSNPKGLLRSASNNTLKRASNFQPIVEENPQPLRSPVIPEEATTASASAAAAAAAAAAPVVDVPTARSSPSNRSEPFRTAPVPGVVSYDSPQTLIGQRDMFLRSRSQGNLLANPSDLNLNMTASTNRTPSESGSLYNYPMYAAAMDVDDLPLSQRKEFMRQSSMNSLTGPSPNTHRMSVGSESAANLATNFDSHQPKRVSTLPSQADREARLASFRSSVAQDLRSGTPILPASGRETPFASTLSLLGGAGGREAEVQRNIEMQRTIMMGQREAEGQQKEMARRQKEWADRAFDERMRSGDLLEAHREAMRKMQRSAKDQ